MTVQVLVSPKEGVLDPEGRALQSALHDLGHAAVNSARVGRVITLELETSSKEVARDQVREMCEKLLANPVIEQYEIVILE